MNGTGNTDGDRIGPLGADGVRTEELLHPRLRDADGAFFRTLVANTSEGILTIDVESTVLFANQAIEGIHGYEPRNWSAVPNSRSSPIASRRPTNDASSATSRPATGTSTGAASNSRPATRRATRSRSVISIRDHEFRGQRLFTGIFRDVSRAKAQEERLESQNERLERFASVLSHDLRNPLNVAQGYTDLLAAEVEDERIVELEESLNRMEELIEDTLTLAQQEGGIGSTRRLPIEAVATETWSWVATGEADLAVDAPGSVEADRGRLASLLENLFRNAVEHGSTSNRSQARDDAVEHGGDGITVRVGSLGEGTGFYVEDTGEGIPEDAREEVFDRGYTTTADGTGLELSIVEEVADAHGWEVRVGESEAGGARFEFRT